MAGWPGFWVSSVCCSRWRWRCSRRLVLHLVIVFGGGNHSAHDSSVDQMVTWVFEGTCSAMYDRLKTISSLAFRIILVLQSIVSRECAMDCDNIVRDLARVMDVLDAEIETVEGALEAVAGQIATCTDRDSLADLRDEEEQLRDEEKQLHEAKKVLFKLMLRHSE
ncbi:hypothetical protein VOLCADRAFT_88739 [Volvox carteri f. nagariensis]|uniref:Uncharacterized protein n=1 Tax=Volvox carteri f. nagariensis TaxID=3068 RepID=D8TPU0_VOLCA|nr:uncharacterized protein VOLCADRAFT_88739 [Volvox carteri f. nagariensis]EFJ50417.1 hypothetical protein VOLCADRAFT_88739 [Volvox carteri f. nagariensis]|eukprot:XP_002948542.1 hypothetical protein VOLCADRAFT_88739 [Volvox carteri f. nagariensis]